MTKKESAQKRLIKMARLTAASGDMEAARDLAVLALRQEDALDALEKFMPHISDVTMKDVDQFEVSESSVQELKAIMARVEQKSPEKARIIQASFPEHLSEAGKQVGVVYHFTTPKGLEDILYSGFKLRNDNRGNISFTRNPRLEFQTSLEEYDDTGEMTGNPANTRTQVRIALDGDKMSHRFKFEPHNDFSEHGSRPAKKEDDEFVQDESEERIMKPEVETGPYVLQIDILNSVEHSPELEEAIQNAQREWGVDTNWVDSFQTVKPSLKAA